MNCAILFFGRKTSEFSMGMERQLGYEVVLQTILILSQNISQGSRTCPWQSAVREGIISAAVWREVDAWPSDPAQRIMLQYQDLTSELPAKWLPTLSGSRATHGFSKTDKHQTQPRAHLRDKSQNFRILTASEGVWSKVWKISNLNGG